MALTALARSSLKQFMIILAEVQGENGQVSGEQLEALMWEKIVGGTPSGNKIPSSCLKRIKHLLPYMPDMINYQGCPALKPCGGLYLPCGAKQADGGQFCAVCEKNTAAIKFGTLEDRGAPGSYTDPNDKHEISYGTWLAKNEVPIEDVYKELSEAGFTFRIPESYLTVNRNRVTQPKRRPGRPGVVKKTVVNEDGTESPIGTSMDGVNVVLGHSSDETLSSDDEADDVPDSPIKEAVVEAKKRAKSSEKPEKKKAEKQEKAEKPEKADKPEKKKAEKKPEKTEGSPKNRPEPSKKKKKSESLEHEEEDTEITVDGEKYIRRGKNIFDSDGTFRGTVNGKKVEWITTSP